MQYLFVFGRNPLLSELELACYLEKNSVEIKNHSLKENLFLLETQKEIDAEKAIKELGGTIAIGRVLCSGKTQEILEFIRDNNVDFSDSMKFSYSIIGHKSENIAAALKAKFKKDRVKAMFSPLRGSIELQAGKSIKGSPSKLSGFDSVFFFFSGEKNFFGIIESVFDSKASEKKDMERPVRRQKLAISPKLAKILVNLSGAREEETLLDPFCGIGVVLQEALLQNINVIGIEIEANAVENCRKNLEWLKQNYDAPGNYQILNADSKKALVPAFDAIATEPSLGKLLRDVPLKKDAVLMAIEFENLLADVLNNLKKGLKKNGRIAFTSPLIKSDKGWVSCNIKKICEKTGLSLFIPKIRIKQPVKDFRQEQFVGREFFVLEKKDYFK